MLNANIKQQINTARDILVGKIPDPKGQIDQITNALIYKFMDDQDRLALTLPGGKANFFVNELKPYAWHKLFDGKLSNQDKANLYVEGIAKLSISKHLPDLFRDIFKDAFLPFRAPDTIAMFLGEINKFDYHHSEDLGNAFEYLLSIMGSQGDAGQFRTPRNIIEFIVDAVDSSKDDHILDPACGTAGFLVEAYKHITKDKKLTPNEIQELAQHIHGVDIDPGMAKIARVNLYLHGFKTPLITEDDTLSDERLWGKKYDVILANPPFMTPKGGIVPHDKFSVKSNRAEVLFTDFIAEHLKLAGRAGVVVPEGIIFQSGKVYKQLRKMLVDDNYLWAVVSLPAGVFNPYSGVKTSILLFDRERSAKNTEILFFKVNNDGFDLGAQRREISKNDLPEALEILKKWKNNEKVENSKALYIEKSKIAESDDYKLSIDQYRTAIDYTNAKWPMVELGEFIEFEQKSKRKSGDGKEDGLYKFFVSSQIQSKFIDKADYLNENLILGTGGNASVHIARNFSTSADTFVFHSNNNQLSNVFLAHILSNNKEMLESGFRGQGIKHLSKEYLLKIKIPLPPLEIQERVVEQIDGYQKIIDGIQQAVSAWKPRIEIDPKWEKVKLGDIGKVCMCKRIFKEQTKSSGDIPFYKIGTFGKSPDAYIDQKLFEEYKSKYSYPTKGTVLLSTSGTIGRTVVFDGEPAYFQDSNIVWIDNDEKKVTNEYLYYAFQTINWATTKGGTIERLYNKQVEGTEISIPSLEVQKQIVEKIAVERALIDGNKKLIEIYEQKTKEVISKLWEE